MPGQNATPLIGWHPRPDLVEWLRAEVDRRGGGRGAQTAILDEALDAYRAVAPREAVRSRLLSDLASTLDQMSMSPESDGETLAQREARLTTGNDGDPGTYRESACCGRWTAWDYAPDGSGDAITVTEDDLPAR